MDPRTETFDTHKAFRQRILELTMLDLIPLDASNHALQVSLSDEQEGNPPPMINIAKIYKEISMVPIFNPPPPSKLAFRDLAALLLVKFAMRLSPALRNDLHDAILSHDK